MAESNTALKTSGSDVKTHTTQEIRCFYFALATTGNDCDMISVDSKRNQNLKY